MAIHYKIKNILSALLIFAIVSLITIALAWSNPLQKTQLLLSNFLYQERPTKNPVVIVAIDNKSLDDQVGLGKQSQWDREYYAQVIENLQKYSPSAITLDILFRTPSSGISQNKLQSIIGDPINGSARLQEYSGQTTHPQDQKLIDTLKTHDNIVLAYELENFPRDNINAQKPFFEYQNLGYWNIPISNDGLLRNYLLKFQDYESLAQQTLHVLQPNLGDIDQPLIINYHTKPLSTLEAWLNNPNFKIIPFIDVYNEDYPEGFDPNYLQDKIVLIGAYYTSSQDNHKTPIDPNNVMPGVMIHAQAIQTILDEAWLRDMTLPEQAAAIALLTLIATAAIFFTRLKFALPITILATGGYLAAAPFAFQQGLIFNLVYPPLAVITALILGYAYRFLTEFRQKSFLHNALGRYVNKTIADQSLSINPQQLALGGEKREITVIFTDIKDFTSISEQLQPQSLVALLNEYFQVMAGIISRHGGTIDKFEGDAIMAFFGAPTPQANHSVRACEAALEMQEALPSLMQKWEQDPPLPGGEPKPQIEFRVGISTGEAIIGNVGFEDHIEYTAMGDIVNLGSRLESANKKYHSKIMISEQTAREVDQFFELRFLDVIRVKGKQKPVKIYELMARHGALDTGRQELIRQYNLGLKFYFERKFIEALRTFNEILKTHPRDYLSDIYAARCEILKRYPPTYDWDFVYNMESK